jgi:hypothetical protein
MAEIPADILAYLRAGRSTIVSAISRITKSADLHKDMQARIRASVALLERASRRWPTSAPTSPRPINTSHSPESTSAGNDSS